MIMERLEPSGDLKKVSSYYALTDELLLLPIPLNFLKDVTTPGILHHNTQA